MTATFITAVGRRKTASASVRMSVAPKASVTIDGKTPKEYFKTDLRAKVAEEALALAESAETYAVKAHIEGGGIAMRFGSSADGNFGSSVLHIHAHLIEPNLAVLADDESWKFKFGQPKTYKAFSDKKFSGK